MPRPMRYLLILLGAWTAASELHGLGLSWVPVGPEKWLHLVVMGAGAALCILRAVLRREERAAWLLLGLGVSAWVLGELYFTAVLWNDASPPVPSWADAGYLSLPPLVFAGLAVLARSRIRGLSKTLWADGLTAGLTAGAISAAVVLEPVVNALGGGQLAIATNLSYPIADLLLLGLICGLLAAGGRRLDRRFAILALGIVLFWASDTIYLIKTAQGTWISGGPFDPGWWAISVCFATAAWTEPRGRAASIRPRPVISVPIVFALISLAILVVGSTTEITLPAVLLATGALISVLGRLILTFREHQAMLDHSRNEASTDPLTGLGNRRALAATLAARLESPPAAPMVLALFDLDGFKSYTDRFGHAAGDALLQRLATGLGTVLAAPAGVYRARCCRAGTGPQRCCAPPRPYSPRAATASRFRPRWAAWRCPRRPTTSARRCVWPTSGCTPTRTTSGGPSRPPRSSKPCSPRWPSATRNSPITSPTSPISPSARPARWAAPRG